MKECIKEGWKVRELKRQINSSLFQRLALSTDKEGVLALANEGHTQFLIAHMSENNNNLDIAKQTIESTLTQNGVNLDNIELNFASKTLSSEEYTIC